MSYVYKSTIFMQLSDNSNNLYRKPWQEIYELLQQELKTTHTL